MTKNKDQFATEKEKRSNQIGMKINEHDKLLKNQSIEKIFPSLLELKDNKIVLQFKMHLFFRKM